MLFFLDHQSGVPFYRQLMEQVRLHVSTGALNAGDELPSIRALAVALGVNPMTVSKACGFLEAEQLLERRPGRSLVVREQTGEQLEIGRLDRLREQLRGAAALGLRLGISVEDAVVVLRDLMEHMARERSAEEDS